MNIVGNRCFGYNARITISFYVQVPLGDYEILVNKVMLP